MIHYQAPDNVGGVLQLELVINPELLALEVPVPSQAQVILGNSNHTNFPPSMQPPTLAIPGRAENVTGFKMPARAKTSNFAQRSLTMLSPK